jgi:hypothetical protein
MLTEAISNIKTGLEYRGLGAKKRREIEHILTQCKQVKILLLSNRVSEATKMLLDTNRVFSKAI